MASAATKNKAAAKPSTSDRDKAYASDRENALAQLEKALAMAGIASGPKTKWICPMCGAVGKLGVKGAGAERRLHCYKGSGTGAHGQMNAIDILEQAGWSYSDAIDDLLDRPRRSQGTERKTSSPQRRKIVNIPVIEEFSAVVDIEVYNALIALGDLKMAQEFYSRWHISPEAVAAMGARYITDPDKVRDALEERFGAGRLVACGLAMPADEVKGGKVRLLVNRNYPVIEPHMHPNGRDVLSMQFRASEKTEERIAAHKAYKQAKEAAEAQGRSYDGPKVEYVAKFLSLRGASEDSRVGGGLPAIRAVALAAGRDPADPVRVAVVEGFKDQAAAATWGRLAYALPGAGVTPPQRVLEEFRRLGVSLDVVFDGDQAGENGASSLVDFLRNHGLGATRTSLPEGMDITDTLVARHATRGCSCAACCQWRSSFGQAA